MSIEEHQPVGRRAITHARIGNLLHDMREDVDDLVKLYNDTEGRSLVTQDEAEITAIRNSINWLLSDILESRKLRAVS